MHLLAEGEGDIDILRKVVEYVYTGLDLNILIITPRRQKQKAQTRPRKEKSIMTVKTEGKTYSDLLKKLKEEVD